MSPPALRRLAVFGLTLITCPALAQSIADPLASNQFEISGRVCFAQGKAAAKQARVNLTSLTGHLAEHTITDSRGKFRFTQLRNGQYTVSAQVQGFKGELQRVEITPAARRMEITIELSLDEANPSHRMTTTTDLLDARIPAEAFREFEEGRNALHHQKVTEAIERLEKAVAIHPAFFDAQWLLGRAYRHAQQWDKAKEALRRALEIKSNRPAVLTELGEVCRQRKEYLEAEQALQAALKLDDRSWQGYFTLGRVYWEMGDPAKAGLPAGRALQLNPDYAEAHLLRANIFMRVGRPQNALIEYEEYLRLAPKGEFAEQTRTLVRQLKQSLVRELK